MNSTTFILQTGSLLDRTLIKRFIIDSKWRSTRSFFWNTRKHSHTSWKQFKTRRRNRSISEVGAEYLRTTDVILTGNERYLETERKLILRKALCQVLEMNSYWVQKREEEWNRKMYTLRTSFYTLLVFRSFALTLLAMHYSTL